MSFEDVWFPANFLPGLNQMQSSLRFEYQTLQTQPPYGGLLSSSCGGLQPLAATKRPFWAQRLFCRTNRRKNGRTDNGSKGDKIPLT